MKYKKTKSIHQEIQPDWSEFTVKYQYNNERYATSIFGSNSQHVREIFKSNYCDKCIIDYVVNVEREKIFKEKYY
jgi:hypothetical protein